MDLNEIKNRNYKATIRRGKITKNTKFLNFHLKLCEEQFELFKEFEKPDFDNHKFGLELADIIIVCLNMAEFYQVDIQKMLEEKTIINENRP